MESDKPAASENPTEKDGGTVTGTTSNQVRSYECTFCKRGFSNAQALGGHMNIHRKDKAKLKQPNSNVLIKNVQPFLDVQNQKAFPFWPQTTEDKPAAGEEIRSNAPKWPLWNMSKQDDTSSRDESETDIADVRQLRLFAETPSAETQKPGEIQVHGELAAEKNLPSDQAWSSELDLELRLGPEPQDSTAATGTRKFF